MNYEGIPYFPHECTLPMPMRLVQSKYGLVGYGVMYKLYEKIFSSGYYTEWNDEICEIFAYEDCRLKPELVSGVVSLCLEKGVFDSEIYARHCVLTSADIQTKFYHAAKHRKSFGFDPELCLIDVEKIRKSETRDTGKKKHPSESEGLFKLYKKAVSAGVGVDFICSSDVFKPWLEQFEARVILFAFALCIRKHKENEDYLFGILGNWKGEGIMYLDDVNDPLLRTPDFMDNHPELQAERILDFMKV